MNNENRVLIRRGARDLSTQEMEQVTGGLRTATFCSINQRAKETETFLSASANLMAGHPVRWPAFSSGLSIMKSLLECKGRLDGHNDEGETS